MGAMWAARIHWGNVGEWVGGVGAIAAIAMTVSLWRVEHRRALRAEERERQREAEGAARLDRVELRDLAEFREAKLEKAHARARMLTTGGGGGTQGELDAGGTVTPHRRDVELRNGSTEPFTRVSLWLETPQGSKTSHSPWREACPPTT